MRKCLPKYMKIGEDGFFVAEKGTDNVIMWCRVDAILMPATANEWFADEYAKDLCVSPQFVKDYAPAGTTVYLWEIGKKKVFFGLKRDSLLVDRNPQQFAYCPLSYGESY